MPLTKTNTDNPIRGIIAPNDNQKKDCRNVIAQLTFPDLMRGPGSLHTEGVARLDMQGRTTTGDANLQVQIGKLSAAAALIAASVGQTTDSANQTGALNAAKSVLNKSLDSGTIWTLTGTLP